MATIIMVAAGLAGLLTCFLKLPHAVRNPDRPALRALCVMLGTFGLAFIVTAPPVTPAVSAALGVPNAGRLIGNALTLISAGALQAMMLYLAHTAAEAWPRVRLRLIVLAVALTGMTVALLSAHTKEDPNFVSGHPGYPPIVIYELFYLGYLSLALTDLLTFSIRYARYAEGALRAGMRVVSAGAVFGIFYFVYRVALLFGGFAHWTGGDESTISAVLAGISGILVAIGATLPLWGKYAALPWRRGRQLLSYHRLAALWDTLHNAVPEVALTSEQAMTGSYRRGEIGIRLYRRVIEIRDAQLILRAHSDPEAVRRIEQDAVGRRLTGDRLRAAVDAAELFTALHAADRPHEPAAGQDREAPEPMEGDARLTSESRYLELVADAFRQLNDNPPTMPARTGS
ncbi:MAB_1171c family putative transporter [Actinoplanes sp. NPDC026623]|uniref:MAB_1171c family putative transporter n=1 Tax=Actinoplanes sp. NPDC026623 TaxID=3155610 RepID=UPI0033F2594B